RNASAIGPVNDSDRDHAASASGGPQPATDHFRKPHQQLLELRLRPCRVGEDMGMAIAFPRRGIECPDLEAAQPSQPETGDGVAHTCAPKPLGRGLQELDRGSDSGPLKPARARFCDAGKLSELEALEDADEVPMVDAFEPI